MKGSRSDIPLQPLSTSEWSLPAHGSTFEPQQLNSRSTAHENVNTAIIIDDLSDDLSGPLLQDGSVVETESILETVSPSPKHTFQTWWRGIRRRLPEGWRFGATVGAILSLCALIGNSLVLLIFSLSVDKENGQAWSFAEIHEGSCSNIENIQLGIHLVINVVSTLLLGASNYCMQCLSAPTRMELNSAHQQGRYLDIGVPSLRNLRAIKGGRLVCWLLLGLSSIPLHLIYNSVFYVSLANNSYDIYFAAPDFEDGEWFDHDLFTDSFSFIDSRRNLTIHLPNGTVFVETLAPYVYFTSPSIIQEEIQTNDSVFEKLENKDCIDAYAKSPLSDRRTLVLVSSTLPRDNPQLGNQTIIDENRNTYGNCNTSLGLPIKGPTAQGAEYWTRVSCLQNSSLYSVTSYQSDLLPAQSPRRSNWFYWICSQEYEYYDFSGSDDLPSLCGEGYWQEIKSNASQWTVDGFKIDYCISERVEHGCKLNMAGRLLIAVIACNAIKVVVMTLVVWTTQDDRLITIGDAAASFIQEPDPMTKGMCLYSREDFYHSSSGVYGCSEAKSFKPEAKRRGEAASRRRWISAISFTLAGLGLVLGLLGFAINDLSKNYNRKGFEFLWSLGVGKVNGFTLIQGWKLPTSGDKAILLAVIVANSPQALFSMLYLLINSLFTSLSLAAEWSRYSSRSASLRVSKRRGNQRSTYFLQVPYRLAIPLMAFSTFLHWIMSQSIFFSQAYGKFPEGSMSWFPSTSVTTCSYSPLGMIITTIAAFTLMAFAVAMGMRRLQSGMPLAGSCSLAISAACHPPQGTSELLPVMWGAIPDIIDDREDGLQVGHCAFSNGPVEPPIEGQLYA